MSEEDAKANLPQSSSPIDEENSSSSSYQTLDDQDRESSSEPPATIPTFRKFAYGVGHIFNELCASMWFTYLVLFFHNVVQLDNTTTGVLILIGQCVDAAATPFIGLLCDKIHGRRKFCHLIGTIMVTLSFFFFWHTCLLCNDHTPPVAVIVYFSIPIIIFQLGWAAVQISHLSLLPVLTTDENERVGLNALR